MKPRIKVVVWNIKRQKIPNRNCKKKRKRNQKIEDIVRSHWDNYKCTNICNVGVPEGEQRIRKLKTYLEKIISEKFPNLVKEIDIQVQELQRSPNKMNTNWHTPIHIIIKMQKVKDKNNILKAAREKQLLVYRGTPRTLSAVFFLFRPEGSIGHCSFDEPTLHRTSRLAPYLRLHQPG